MTKELLTRYNPPSCLQLDTLQRTRGLSLKLFQKRAQTCTANHFFSNRIMSFWNSLTDDTVTVPTTNGFQSRVDCEWLNQPLKTKWDAANWNHCHLSQSQDLP